MNRRQIVLLGLLGATVLFALLLGFDTGGGNDGGAIAGGDPPTRRAARRGGDEEAVHEVVELRSGRLDDVASGYEPGRDPFRFYQPPRPEPEPRPEPQPPPQPVEERVEAPPPRPAGPQPPPIELEFVGSFGPEEQPIAVFTDGEEIYNVRLGDVIDGKFRLIRIGYESVDLAFVDFPEVPAERLPIGRANGG